MGNTVTFTQKGDFGKLNSFLERALEKFDIGILDKYGAKGVKALSEATPKETGLLAQSWYYTIERTPSGVTINWCNSDIEGGYNVAILIQYGHGTRSGGYVQGRDFINPAIRPIFDEIAESAWKEVSKA